jgi:hypothetical protein
MPQGEHAMRRHRTRAVIADEMEEMEQCALRRVRRNERALALLAYHDVLCRELVEGLAHGALADLEFGGEAELGRQCLAGPPRAGDEALHQQVLDLRVKRPETGGGGIHWPANLA